MRKLFLIPALCLLTLNSQAAEVDGHKVPDNLSAGDTELVLNGAGLREKFFMDLYVASLYLTAKQQDASAIIVAQDPMAIRLHIVSGLITSEKMTEATLEGFDNATQGNTAPIQDKIDAFMETFKEEIKEGDVFELVYDPSKGVLVYKNGTLANTITGDAFKQALFGIWLSDKPAQKSLKKGLLGS